jgi:hypothetical protein
MVNALAVMALMHSPKFAAESVFQTSVHTSEDGVHTSEDGVHTSEDGVHTSEDGVHTSEDGVDGSRSVIDPSTTSYSYFGNSEGGIFGGVYMALSTQVERGLLGVSGVYAACI